ncbi:hypothetical protein PHLGIDRAFT_16463 [Phlebiopsis gigantea 11061_1 CR5-6]|uniref:Uncharacterized protein n=1 Tax=Phlebiopsis gigantea (strain 11061_1 CR5-6) TaxID=745531 RepID=A0A0C3NDE1_PHLG1|nr:hypothetical protein PHLGIDRAFT_16463 [Phlebiopsis gigantea 11061_1 CR5-6]
MKFSLTLAFITFLTSVAAVPIIRAPDHDLRSSTSVEHLQLSKRHDDVGGIGAGAPGFDEAFELVGYGGFGRWKSFKVPCHGRRVTLYELHLSCDVNVLKLLQLMRAKGYLHSTAAIAVLSPREAIPPLVVGRADNMQLSITTIVIALAPLLSFARPLGPSDSLLLGRSSLNITGGSKELVFSGAPPSSGSVLQWLRGSFGGTRLSTREADLPACHTVNYYANVIILIYLHHCQTQAEEFLYAHRTPVIHHASRTSDLNPHSASSHSKLDMAPWFLIAICFFNVVIARPVVDQSQFDLSHDIGSVVYTGAPPISPIVEEIRESDNGTKLYSMLVSYGTLKVLGRSGFARGNKSHSRFQVSGNDEERQAIGRQNTASNIMLHDEFYHRTG